MGRRFFCQDICVEAVVFCTRAEKLGLSMLCFGVSLWCSSRREGHPLEKEKYVFLLKFAYDNFAV